MNNHKVKSTFVIASTLLISIVLIFTGGLNIASFKENYTQSVVSSYAVAGGESVRNIEYAVKYGKPLDNFLGIEANLQNIREETPTIEEVKIALPEGKVLYNQNGLVVNEQLPKHLIDLLLFSEGDREFIYVLDNKQYHVFLPIYNSDNHWIGSLNLIFDESVITSHTNDYMWKLISYLLIFAIVSLACIVIFVKKVSIVEESGEIRKKRVLGALIVILGVVQVIFGIMNYQMFNGAYKEIANNNAAFTARVITKDISSVIEKGVPYESLVGIEEYLQNTIQTVPVIARINIVTQNGETLFSTSELNMNSTESSFIHHTSLLKDHTNTNVQLETVISKEYISSKMKNIILDTGTILVTSFLFMVELTLFILFYLKKKFTAGKKLRIEEVEEQELAIIRPLTFLLFIGIFLSISFIPNVMNELYEPILGLSKNVILGLPLTIEMLFGGIATIIAGVLIDKKGWRAAFYTGLLLLGIGAVLSGVASGAISFILARGVVGAGYGFSLMALRAFVNSPKNAKAKSTGLTSMFSGLYAGLNCGVIVGAMLADQMGYRNVFFIAFGLILLTSLFSLIYLKQEQTVTTIKKVYKETEQSKINLFQFFSTRQVFALFLFIIIPASISGMFLDYFFPIFAEEEGISSSNVGRAFLLNGLCIVYLGPLISNYLKKYISDFKAILLGGLLVAVGMLYFSWQGTVVAAFITVILLGLSDSFGLVAQNNYLMKQNITQKFGVGKVLGYMDNARKVGQMIGPMIFGFVLTIGQSGISILSLFFFGALIAFLFIGRVRMNKLLEKG